jgi:hypothetical protein
LVYRIFTKRCFYFKNLFHCSQKGNIQFCKSFIDSKGALVHRKMGVLCGPNHINPIVQVCSCTGKHYFCHTADCFDYPCTKGCSVIHRYSLNIIFQILPWDKIEGWGACGPGDWSTTINPSARNCFIRNLCTFLLQCGGQQIHLSLQINIAPTHIFNLALVS